MTSVAKQTVARTVVSAELRAPGVGEHPLGLLGTGVAVAALAERLARNRGGSL
jgi:hypothetical protein